MTAPLSRVQPVPENPESAGIGVTGSEAPPREADGNSGAETAAAKRTALPEPGSAELAPYWVERKRYLKQLRKVPELRQRFWSAILVYFLRRVLWSFGFFPVFIAFWVPLVMASFNPVVMVTNIMPELQGFVASNPEMQANTVQTLVMAWLSVGFFFLIFDFVLTPFRSPYEYEADVYMRAWEHYGHSVNTDAAPASPAKESEPFPDKV